MRALWRRWLPLPWLLRARRLWFWPLELRDRVLGRHDPSLPPRWLRFVGTGDFHTVGARLLGHCRELAQLRPDEDVLEVGCGAGRLARALTGYLTPAGSYEGFDVVADAVRWCRRALSARHPNFRFRHADIHNGGYNPTGRQRALDFVFPYPDRSFDLVILASVFTHMLPAEVAHYLGEIRRVLRPEGRCLASFFLLNDEARALMLGPRSALVFRHEGAGYWTTRPDHPEDAVAYREEDVRALYARAGLRVCAPIQPGGWCGREGAREGQDLILASPLAASR
ncbi:MAG: class I SAM-dependent methyltransferase [Gemmataceae bacterium]|nr:class I SAM-dependent methyltransferase [Gemmataceae bacterium]